MVGQAVRRDEAGDACQVVPGGEHRRLVVAVGAVLAEADVRHQRVAETLAIGGFRRVAALAGVVVLRLGWAAVAERAVGLAVGPPEVPEVAQSVALGVDLRR